MLKGITATRTKVVKRKADDLSAFGRRFAIVVDGRSIFPRFNSSPSRHSFCFIHMLCRTSHSQDNVFTSSRKFTYFPGIGSSCDTSLFFTPFPRSHLHSLHARFCRMLTETNRSLLSSPLPPRFATDLLFYSRARARSVTDSQRARKPALGARRPVERRGGENSRFRNVQF